MVNISILIPNFKKIDNSGSSCPTDNQSTVLKSWRSGQTNKPSFWHDSNSWCEHLISPLTVNCVVFINPLVKQVSQLADSRFKYLKLLFALIYTWWSNTLPLIKGQAYKTIFV